MAIEFLQDMPSAAASPEVPANENFEALEPGAVYAKNPVTSAGLALGYVGGRWGGFSISSGTLTLTGSSTNYVVANRATGAVSFSTASTNWDNPLQYARLHKATTDASAITAIEDHRFGKGGAHGGQAAGVPQNSKSAAYTTVLGDANGHILHPAADNNARVFTIDSNANVPYEIGTTLTFVNKVNVVTIAITSDTLTFAGGGTGSRTLAAPGIATALKITATEWMINGANIT